jgi:hypothetical protein
MATFTGLGQALGAIGGGVLAGERLGEAEAFRRKQIDENNELKRLLAQLRTKPGKEELPYEVQSLIDTRNKIYGPTGTYDERNQWQQSGGENVYRLTTGALAAHGPEAARLAYAIANQPEGADTSGLQARLASITGGGQQRVQPNSPALQSPQPGPAQFQPAGNLGQFLDQAQPQQAPPGGGIQPSLKPDFQYTPSELEAARTGLTNTQTYKIKALTPQEVEFLKARTGDVSFQQDRQRRQLNLDAAQADFTNALNSAQLLIRTGQTDLRIANSTWSDLLNAAARLHLNGGSPSDMLKPLLFNRGIGGATTPNPEAISRYLAAQGLDAGDIGAIIQGAQPGAGLFGPAPTGGAAGGVQQPGGAPVLPPVGGQSGGGLAAAQGLAGQLGFKVTSTTGGKHNEGSLHSQGRALDLGVKGKTPEQIQQMMQAYAQAGYVVRDERKRPPGQKVWSAPHIHIEIPEEMMGGGGGGGQPQGSPISQTTAGEVPGGGGGSLRDLGVPGVGGEGAPKSPYSTNTVEGRLWNQYASGVDVLAAAKGTPYEGIAANVVAEANRRQRRVSRAGIPVADRFGARVPEGTDFAGTLGYKEVGIPQITTTDVEPEAGFGTRQPAQGQQVIQVPSVSTGVSPPAAATAPPAEEPQGGNPSLVGYDGGGLKLPPFKLPNLGIETSLEGASNSVVGYPTRKAKVVNNDKGPKVKAKGLDEQSAAFQAKMEKQSGVDKGRASKNVVAEIEKFKKNKFAPPIGKWLAKHKIGKPETKRAVYADVIGKLIPKLVEQGRSDAWIAKNLISTLDQYMKPGS